MLHRKEFAMPLIPLQIPAGVYRNGTEFQAAGRWYDANLVRWVEGTMRPVGGWQTRDTAGSTAPRAMVAWSDLSGDRRYAIGFHDALKSVLASGTITDITPSDLVDGTVSAVVNVGYGGGFYGFDEYGVERPDTGNFSEATTWALDNWGEYLVACSVKDGRLLEWQLDATVGAETVTNGTFAADSDWTKGSGWTISAGVASFSGSAVAALSQVLTILNGETYEVVFTLTNASANEARIVVTTGSGDVLDTTYGTGTHRVRFLSDGTSATLKFEPAAAVASAFDVDNVSVKKVPIAETIANAPINNLSLVVTSERFLFALGAGGNPRKVQWSDREDNTTWTPLATNEAGDLELQTSGQIMLGIRTRGQTLIITDQDAHAATYQGPPFVYGFERVGSACGVVSRKAAASVDEGVFWMGQRGFHAYAGGAVQDLPSEVADYVFGDINRSQASKVYAVSNQQFNEVWWFYPSSGSLENNRYVSYNYAEGHWAIGSIDRTAGVDAGVFRSPIWADASGVTYSHESGLNHNGSSVFAETGPISLGVGDAVMAATELIPDEKTQGDVTATFRTRFHPNDTLRSYGPYSMANPTSVRFTGRQIQMRVDGARLADWRVGVMRIDAQAGGRR
jgi:hypothetical protein